MVRFFAPTAQITELDFPPSNCITLFVFARIATLICNVTAAKTCQNTTPIRNLSTPVLGSQLQVTNCIYYVSNRHVLKEILMYSCFQILCRFWMWNISELSNKVAVSYHPEYKIVSFCPYPVISFKMKLPLLIVLKCLACGNVQIRQDIAVSHCGIETYLQA